MKTKVTVLVDGGYLREILKKNEVFYNEIAIQNMVRACVDDEHEVLHKALYYDCKSYKNKHSHEAQNFRSDTIIENLAKQEKFAVRLGSLKFMGLADNGKPIYVQKGVDIRIAIDLAKIIMANRIDRIILISGDTDLIPAMKLARIHDIEVVLAAIYYLSGELREHMDELRKVDLEQLLDSGALRKFTPHHPNQ